MWINIDVSERENFLEAYLVRETEWSFQEISFENKTIKILRPDKEPKILMT